MVEELLAASGIGLTYETVRRWSVKFGSAYPVHRPGPLSAAASRRRAPRFLRRFENADTRSQFPQTWQLQQTLDYRNSIFKTRSRDPAIATRWADSEQESTEVLLLPHKRCL
jgi:hypothetical protein